MFITFLISGNDAISLKSRPLNFRVFIHAYNLWPQTYLRSSLIARVLNQSRNKSSIAILETFSITFFMGNCKPQNVTWPRPCGHVCSLQFTFEPQEGLPAVSDLRQGFFATKNCTASRLKVWTSFLYPFAMSLFDFWSRINELLLIFGRLKWCTSTWWKQHGGPKQWTRSSNQFYIPFCRTNKGKYSVPIQG